MEFQAAIDRISRHMRVVYLQMKKARQREDWESYWRLRRSWLAMGRLIGDLAAQQADERSAQLTLVDDHVGRHHDRPA